MEYAGLNRALETVMFNPGRGDVGREADAVREFDSPGQQLDSRFGPWSKERRAEASERTREMHAARRRNATVPVDVPSATEILARRWRYGGAYLDTRRPWDETARAELAVLAAAGASIDRAAEVMGRSPTSIAWRCKTDKVKLPAAWAKLIRPIYKPKPRTLWVPLAYPYINFRRAETETLMLVNEMVARALPGREDVCQDIMLAILERGLSPTREVVNEFIRKFRRENYENSGYALSLDAPLYDTDRTIADTLIGESSFDYWNAL